MVGDLRGDFVTLKDVLQRFDFETKPVGHAEEHEDLIPAVAMAMDLEVAAKDVGQGFEAQVAARLLDRYWARGADGPRSRAGFFIVVPGLAVSLSLREGTNKDGLDAKTGVREAAVGTLDVFTERELHAT